MVWENFKKVFWGYLFLVIGFRIQGIDILPNFIGYIIIIFGIKNLLEENEHFQKVLNSGYILTILSIFDVYQPVTTNTTTFQFSNPLLAVVAIVSVIADLYFSYHLFMGISNMAEKRTFVEIKFKSEKYWGYYWKLLLAMFGGILLVFLPTLVLIYMLVVLILTIVLHINILRFFWDLSKMPDDVTIE